MDQWGVISLAKDKLDLEAAESQRRKDGRRRRLHQGFILRQILEKERKIKEGVRQEQLEDSRAVKECVRDEADRLAQERDARRIKTQKERQELLLTLERDHRSVQTGYQDKLAYGEHLRQLAKRVQEEDSALRRVRLEVARSVQTENLNRSCDGKRMQQIQHVEEIQKDKQDIEYNAKKLEAQEARWKQYFKRKLRRIEREQKAVVSLNQTAVLSGTKDPNEEERFEKEKAAMDQGWAARVARINAEKKVRRKQMVESLQRLIGDRKRNELRELAADVLDKTRIAKQTEEYQRELHRRREAKRNHAREYSSTLMKQIWERTQREKRDELELSPEERGLNQDLLQRLGLT